MKFLPASSGGEWLSALQAYRRLPSNEAAVCLARLALSATVANDPFDYVRAVAVVVEETPTARAITGGVGQVAANAAKDRRQTVNKGRKEPIRGPRREKKR